MVTTERLIIKPLTLKQLQKYILADGSLEEEFQTHYIPRTITFELQEAIEQTIIPKLNDSKYDYLYTTLWIIIAADSNHLIGDLCFIGEPNEEGEIEIGYGIYESFREKGYMKEAINGMIQWASEQHQVKSIIAHTTKFNQASFILLQKNNFVKIDELEFLYKWQFMLDK
ncbi:RimJ/RimL family protein N-acetyltransferase [Pedobacter cryoconitis]|uniref:RimJ/RimL family protein N-acetyltransferase n=1 Tax=Pedobacter cryoconitis TaxID=188932 RepID=A0A7W9DM89_9SPHI|nr:GNAT family N-acetyltransferase [Pedobacter cryoconitis]MBB5624082.1 RimJ/RimL family protein N-acetyltransferase [Pedobacter cryoconitis]